MKMLFSLLFVLAAGTAQAGSKSAALKVEILKNHAAYTLVENKGTEVVLESSEVDAVLKNTMDGETSTSTKNTLPRKEKGEFDKQTIKKLSDKKVLIISESLLYADTEVGQIAFRERFEGEADLTRGTWDDLVNNRDVQLTYTKKAKAALEKQAADNLAKTIVRELEPAIESETGMDVQISVSLKLKYSSAVAFNGTLQRLTSNNLGNMTGRLTLRW